MRISDWSSDVCSSDLTNLMVMANLQEVHVSLVLCFRQRDAGKIRVPIEQPGDVDDVAAGTTDNGGIRVEARHHIPRLRESIVDKDVGVSVVGQINGISSVAADDDVVTGKVFNLLCGTITKNGIVTGRSSPDIGAAVNRDADTTGSRIAFIIGGIAIDPEIPRSRFCSDIDNYQIKLAPARS